MCCEDSREIASRCPECRGEGYFYRSVPASWDDPGSEESFACNECGGLGFELTDAPTAFAAAASDNLDRLDAEDWDTGFIAPLLVAEHSTEVAA